MLFNFSIQTVSLWVIHHRRHFKKVVEVWVKDIKRVKPERKLTLLYLANDVIQNSKKKGPEYGKEFGSVLIDVFNHIATTCTGEDIFNRIYRILSIWEERGVYDAKQIKIWYQSLHKSETGTGIGTGEQKRKIEEKKTEDNVKKQKLDETKTQTVVEVNGKKETHVTLSPKAPEDIDPPEPEVLIKMLMELEHSASSDAVVREKITNLSPEITEISMLSKLVDKEQAGKLALQVEDAIKLLNDYNSRLAEEMSIRKRLTVMLRDFQLEQKELLIHAEKRLEEYKDKLKKVKEMQVAVKEQLKKLPDLTALPDVSPLPSAGDLFNLKR